MMLRLQELALSLFLGLGYLSTSTYAFVVTPSNFHREAAVIIGGRTGSLQGASIPSSESDDAFSLGQEGTVANDEMSTTTAGLNRRQVFRQAIGAATCLGLSSAMIPNVALAAGAGGIGSSPDAPIVVLGAGGKVGKLCTEILAKQGLYTRAVTRSGRAVLNEESPYVTYAPGDVTKLDSVREAVKSASGVIFAASASGKSKGGDPAHVDYLGAYNSARACLDGNVPKFVLISAGTVTRPDSAGFKATNFFVKYVYGDKIMDYKIAGEAATRDLYAQAGKHGYAIVRPGGLNERPSVGPSKVHVSQGDVYSSEVTREDVALVTVAALLKGKATDDVTFELNQVEGLGKAIGSLPDLPAELVHAGAPTFDALLDGLLTDEQIKAKYPDLINDFRGSGIEPVTQLA